MDQNLQVFDLKLRHMREDIATIEARNNTLEMETRNNAKLLSTLRELLENIKIDENAHNLLENGVFELKK